MQEERTNLLSDARGRDMDPLSSTCVSILGNGFTHIKFWCHAYWLYDSL